VSRLPFLSICIPSFNRKENLVPLVKELLRSSFVEFEVVVLDNGSKDGGFSELAEIEDSRLVLLTNKENIGGLLNPIYVFKHARGTYAILCLDKDWIDADGIQHFCNFLTDHPHVAFGRCTLNLSIASPSVVFDQRLERLVALAYGSQHPTGCFYRVDYLLEVIQYPRLKLEVCPFAFLFDVINGEFSFLFPGAVVNLPLVYSEPPVVAAMKRSFTYTDGNLFFFPRERAKVFVRYLGHQAGLGLSSREFGVVAAESFLRTAVEVTLGYKDRRQDSNVCSHYGLEPQRVCPSDELFHLAKYVVRVVFFAVRELRVRRQVVLFLAVVSRLVRACEEKVRRLGERGPG